MRKPQLNERLPAGAGPHGPRRVERRPSGTFKRIVSSLLLAFALVMGTGLGFLYFSNETVRETVNVIIHRDYPPSKAFPGRTELNVLLLGRDVDRDRRGHVVNTRGRTDTIIVAHLDFVNKTANLLSIPRDTYVKIPGRRGKHKINAAHAYGGPELVVDTVEEYLGVRPDDYVVVDYDAFVQSIDRIGGLDIKVDKQLDYDDNWGQLHIHLKPGLQRLDGNQCMGFVRYRKSNDGHGDSDVVRIDRQHEFVRAAKQALMRPSAMIKAPHVLSTVRENVNSSLNFTQQLSLAYFLKTLPAASIHTETLAGEEGRVYARADEDEVRKIVHRMFY
ncbi:MAG: LCP family protein [Armatimonadota bacterium]|nr:LCP family protein [Armatimonadota bacterium]